MTGHPVTRRPAAHAMTRRQAWRQKTDAEHGPGASVHPTAAALNSLGYHHWRDLLHGGEPTEDQDQAMVGGLEELIRDLQGLKRQVKKRIKNRISQ